MPIMPPWAEGARIVYDTEYNLAFVRRHRRALWKPWLVYKTRLVRLEGQDGHLKLDEARRAVLKAVGLSIENHVMALHEGSRYIHLQNPRHSVAGQPYHVCGAPVDFRTGYQVADITCPRCLAIMAEDLDVVVREAGVDKVAQEREHVRTVREINALGKAVTGEPAIEEL